MIQRKGRSGLGRDKEDWYTQCTKHLALRVAHTLYRMQGCVVHRGIKTVGRESSWCRLNSEYHKAFALFFIPS